MYLYEIGGDDKTQHQNSTHMKYHEDNDPGGNASSRFASFFAHRRMPRFGEAHHKRVPTPMKKRRPSNPKKFPDDPPTPSSENEDDRLDPTGSDYDRLNPSGADSAQKDPKPLGVPDPYYPIYLPIDQAFKAKYVFHHRRGKTFQERVYVFLEHPCGWLCFIYHFAV
ncbi:hypothetical protein M8J77_003602 [Diaphorina citri]|nr:hypothetical protein M8J77_003602 [Diaphorina citri]